MESPHTGISTAPEHQDGSFELPSPELLAAHESVARGRADWRIRMAEEEAVHRRFVEKVLAIGYVVRPVAVGVVGLVLVLVRVWL